MLAYLSARYWYLSIYISLLFIHLQYFILFALFNHNNFNGDNNIDNSNIIMNVIVNISDIFDNKLSYLSKTVTAQSEYKAVQDLSLIHI